MSALPAETIEKVLAQALALGFARKDYAMVQQALDKGASAQHVMFEALSTKDEKFFVMAFAAGVDLDGPAHTHVPELSFIEYAMKNLNLVFLNKLLDAGADPNFYLGKQTIVETALDCMSKDQQRGVQASKEMTALVARLMAALPGRPIHKGRRLEQTVTLSPATPGDEGPLPTRPVKQGLRL